MYVVDITVISLRSIREPQYWRNLTHVVGRTYFVQMDKNASVLKQSTSLQGYNFWYLFVLFAMQQCPIPLKQHYVKSGLFDDHFKIS